MPLISAILPVKNGQKYITNAVKSTLLSLPRDSELVVLDDGSSDKTACLLAKISDRRLRVLQRADGVGLPGALNELIGRTDSDIVMRMDADDIMLPWRLKVQLPILKSGADWVFSSVIHLGPGRRIRPTRSEKLSCESLEALLLLENPIAHSTAIFRRSAIDAIGGYRNVGSEDYELWMRAAASGHRLVRGSVPVLLYRHHSGQVTADDKWIERSRIDVNLSQAHRNLSKKILGEDFDCLSLLRKSAGIDTNLNELTRFLESLDSYVSEDPGRRSSKRLHRVRRQVEVDAASLGAGLGS